MSILDDMFQTYGAPTVQHWFGVTVTLKRGPRETTGVTATWSRVPEDVDGEFIPTKVVERMFRIDVTAYVIDQIAVEPQKHDRIIEGNLTFEVLPTDRAPEVERSGDGFSWLIRAKKV